MKPILNKDNRLGKSGYYNKEQRKLVRELCYLRKTIIKPPKTIKKVKGLYPSQRKRKYEIAETMLIHKLELAGIKA